MKATFHPQIWSNDYAIEADPTEPVEFKVGEVPDNLQDDTYESDDLRNHANAPEWVRDWPGPFFITLERRK